MKFGIENNKMWKDAFFQKALMMTLILLPMGSLEAQAFSFCEFVLRLTGLHVLPEGVQIQEISERDDLDERLWSDSIEHRREAFSIEIMRNDDTIVERVSVSISTSAEIPEHQYYDLLVSALTAVDEEEFDRIRVRHTHPYFFADRSFTPGDQNSSLILKAVLERIGLTDVVLEEQLLYPRDRLSLEEFHKKSFTLSIPVSELRVLRRLKSRVTRLALYIDQSLSMKR